MILLVLLCSSTAIMADEVKTVIITDDIPEESRQRETELTENIAQSFTWAIPARVPLSDNNSFTVKVTKAHLYSDVQLKISISGNGTIQLKENEDYFLGSKVTLKRDGNIINGQDPVLTVDSSEFSPEADTNEKTADISLDVERNPFQLAGNYTGKITFIASLSRR